MSKAKKTYILKKEVKKIGKEAGDYYNDELGTDYADLIAKGVIEEEAPEEKPAKKPKAAKKAAEKEETTAIEAVVPSPAVVEDQPLVPKDYKTRLTRAQIEVIKEQFAKGASDVELQMFLYVCERTGLDPFSKQIHLVPRWDSKLGKEVRGVIIGIDGFRSIAERTGNYAGNSDPIFDGESVVEFKESVWENGRKTEKKSTMTVPTRATVTIKKAVAGVLAEFTATAEWDEYYPGDKQGMMWRKMPKVMLGKCAEAKALRKAFPAVMSGLYVAEEMHQAQAPSTLAAAEGDFQKAQMMISKTTNIEGLERVKPQLIASPKYTDDQKGQLGDMIDRRVAELRKVQEDQSGPADTEPTIDA